MDKNEMAVSLKGYNHTECIIARRVEKVIQILTIIAVVVPCAGG